MATFLELWDDRGSLFTDIKRMCRLADENRLKEYNAAIKIQSWFRGCRVRAYIHYLNECATVIQAQYKGHYYRKKYQQKLKEYYNQQKQNFYNKMATMIQSLWRGYYTRKFIHNYYAQKKYLQGLVVKNDAVRNELTEYCDLQLTQRLKREEDMEKLRRSQEARKYHYMLSTESSSGVFNSLSFEEEMKAVKYHRNQFPQRKGPIDKPSNNLKSKDINFSESNEVSVDLSATSGDCRIRHNKLPPIKEKGPFRTPIEVYNQRRRPLRPSLRVATPYDSIEQARKELRLKDEQKVIVKDKFLPFSKFHLKYNDPMVGTPTPYTTMHCSLRDERVKKKFNNVVSPIPIFEELNQTY